MQAASLTHETAAFSAAFSAACADQNGNDGTGLEKAERDRRITVRTGL
jgi:hypothetical protein